ncbi:hypothetical protein HZB93_03875 [Candidatus Falkowbacteria bacterium]|nr:hypothetical protein [Candidatus Falkowbacteria bacterium]
MPENLTPQTKNYWLSAARIFRYVFGIGLILFVLVGVPLLTNQSPVLILMFMFTFPVAFILDPIIAAGIYFMFTSKFRWRFDVTILIILVLCFYGLYALAHQNGQQGPSIKGEAVLKVTVVTDKNEPVKNLEVDVAETPGPPAEGGSASTDDQGIAAFSIKPGKYVVFFNSGNFPANLEYPEDTPTVEVSRDKSVEQKIILKTK